jgi:hypothetical protein
MGFRCSGYHWWSRCLVKKTLELEKGGLKGKHLSDQP